MALEATITLEEVKEAVWGCEGSKAPGPDGVNFNFIKHHWDLLKHDFYSGIKQFEAFGELARGVNPSFICLVPKVKDPLIISDYRPICLIGFIYKVISKILSN